MIPRFPAAPWKRRGRRKRTSWSCLSRSIYLSQIWKGHPEPREFAVHFSEVRRYRASYTSWGFMYRDATRDCSFVSTHLAEYFNAVAYFREKHVSLRVAREIYRFAGSCRQIHSTLRWSLLTHILGISKTNLLTWMIWLFNDNLNFRNLII